MTTKASCGHEVESEQDLIYLNLKQYTRDWRPSVRYGSFCADCAEKHKGDILNNREEEIEWLNTV